MSSVFDQLEMEIAREKGPFMLRSQERQLSVLSLGVVVFVLVAAGAVPATIPERSAETSLAVISRMPDLKHGTVSEAPRKITRPALSPSKAARIRVPAATSLPEPLSMPPETVAAMIKMATPVTFAPPARLAVTASAEGGVPASRTEAATRPQAVEIIRSLIERIEIQPGKERGHCEVIIVGALAQILAFAQQKTTAASTGDSGTFLMVAGVGFEPTTFRL